MATISNPILFFTTSPRSPAKMIPEIALLHDHFSREKWNRETQERFTEELAKSNFFEGDGAREDKAFSARDRINRAPKALGFVDLSPSIALTQAGEQLISGRRPQEVFLRQLLKFQLPSPYHKENKKIIGTFCIRPYLEILRLIYDLGYLTFDELKIFALQMTDYHRFEEIKADIIEFREEKPTHKGKYKSFAGNIWTLAVLDVFSERISKGKTKTRETNDTSLKKFIATQKGNMRDYADACFRYLRFTGLVSISHNNRSISIFRGKERDVEYILCNTNRNPVYIDDEKAYKAYLFAPNIPLLDADNRESVIDAILKISSYTKQELRPHGLEKLKDIRDDIISRNKESIIRTQVEEIKSYALYSEIIDTFNQIISKECFDAPLMLEYNTWRAMTMLDGGNIQANLKFDDAGQPLSTASGNRADIECDYDTFSLAVEVTMQTGQRQYETEGEPVARHYGQIKKKSGKETYCVFIAPIINPATLAHFYVLNHMPVALYGGKSKIIPLELDLFMRLVENSYIYPTQPVPLDIQELLEQIMQLCESASDENEWLESIRACVDAWLAP